MSASSCRTDRRRSAPARLLLDKLPKFDHSLHFDVSLDSNCPVSTSCSPESSSNKDHAQHPLQQSISHNITTSTSVSKRPSMLDITAPYAGETPPEHDEEILITEQEGDIVDYINEAQDQDGPVDWPLYPPKDNLPDLYAIPQSFLQITKPLARLEFKCHHISMSSVIVPTKGPPGFVPICHRCGRIPPTGVLYYCQFDVMNDYFDRKANLEPPQGESKDVRYMHRLGLSSSIIEQIKNGLFTDVQVQRLKQQKLDVRRVIRRNMGMEDLPLPELELEETGFSLSKSVMYDRTRVRDFAYDLEPSCSPPVVNPKEDGIQESRDQVVSQQEQGGVQLEDGQFHQPLPQNRPRCGFQCCYACWRDAGGRNFQRLDSIINSDPLDEYLVEFERLHTHIRYEPVIPVHIVQNLGTRPVAYPAPTFPSDLETDSQGESPGVSRYGTPLPAPPEVPSRSPRRSLYQWEFPSNDLLCPEQAETRSRSGSEQMMQPKVEIELEVDDGVPARTKLELMTKKDSKVEEYEG